MLALLSVVATSALVVQGTGARESSLRWTHLGDPRAEPEARESVDLEVVEEIRSARAPRSAIPRAANALSAPPVGTVFNGLRDHSGLTPPDTNGDVSPLHYVQSVNQPGGASFAVYDKTGVRLVAPTPMESLWDSGVCSKHGNGDPVVKYDGLADRWIMSQLGFKVGARGPGGPFYLCVFLSATGDIRDGGTAYTFFIDDNLFPDYPKLAVWSDGYYMTMHLFSNTGPKGQAVIALDRTKMLAGEPADQVVFFVNPNDYGILPSDVEGPTPPPEGSPNYLAVIKDDDLGAVADRVNLYGFHVDWTNPDQSRIDTLARLDAPRFDSKMCRHSLTCIPQKGTRMRLDALASDPQGTFTMHPTSYRNFGTHESLLLNHAIQVSGARAGIRWYELRDPNGTPVIYQSGNQTAEKLHRWMGSISINELGDVALGYSASGRNSYPSIRYAARRSDDPLGQMTQGEAVLVAGGNSQKTSPRWGDYTSMSVDPTDDCTFWYTNEYYPAGKKYWHTAIASFALPGCN